MKALKIMQNSILHEHALKLSLSVPKIETEKRKNKRKTGKVQESVSCKIVCKNLAFEANKRDIKEIFKFYGDVKSVRIPKKMDGSNRGFAFVEFSSAE